MALSKITNLSITDDAVRTVGIQDDNVTLAKLGDGTQGDILYYGASGAPARLGFGTSGDFLKTQGTGANPAWAAPGGGKVLQVVQDVHTALCTITTATFAPFSASLAVAITPASTSNDILLLVNLGGVDAADYGWLDIQRAIDGGATVVNISGTTYGMSGVYSGNANRLGQSYMFLDSPSTTSEITYSPTGRDDEGSHTVKINRNGSTSSQIIAMEIEG